MIEQGVERGADGAAGVEHVVHEHDVLAGDGELDVGGIVNGFFGDGGKIVAVEIDVEDADGHFALFELLDFGSQTHGQGDAAAADSDEGEFVKVLRLLENLVGETHQSAVDLGSAH